MGTKRLTVGQRRGEGGGGGGVGEKEKELDRLTQLPLILTALLLC